MKMKFKFSIVRHAWLWVNIAIVLTISSCLAFLSNDRYSEEFTSGISLGIQGNYSDDAQKANIEDFLNQKGYVGSRVYLDFEDNLTTIKIQTKMKSDADVSALSEEIKQYLVDESIISDSQQEIVQQKITGPSVGSYMQKATVKALIIGLIFIVIYLLFSFSAIRNYISPSVLGLIVLITMVFDIALPMGAYGIWMHFNETIQVDTIFVIALLTIMGYCINDTIVIFDRIRENFQNKKTGKDVVYGNMFETSIRQTLNRSIATSVSTLLVVLAMFIFGTGIIRTFSFIIGVGIIFGTFSSIFLAAPLAYLMSGKFGAEKGKL